MVLFFQLSILLVMLVIAFMCALQHYRSLNILVLGAGSEAAKFLQDFNTQRLSDRYKVLGFVRSHNCEKSIAPELRLNPELKLPILANRLSIRTIVIATDNGLPKKWIQQLLDCKLNGIKVIEASALTGKGKQRVTSSEETLQTPEQV